MQYRKVPSSPVSIFLGREGSARGGGRGTTGSNPPARFLAEAPDPAAESRERDLFPIVGFGTEAAVAIGAGWTAPEEDSPPAAGTAPEQQRQVPRFIPTSGRIQTQDGERDRAEE